MRHSHQARPRQAPRTANHLYRAIKNLIKRDGDFCTLCRAPFEHNCRTFGGETVDGAPAVICERCVGKLRLVVTSGVYLAHHYDFLQGGAAKSYTTEQIEAAINATQQAVRSADQQLGDALRRGGVGKVRQVGLLDTVWKDDDREWFAQHPERSHRIRAAYPGELATHTTPEGHVLIALVRQVTPGTRMKLGCFLRQALFPAPDDEGLAHAFFDLISRGEPVGRDELLALTAVYRGSERAQ